jgi:hypothetical protein
MLPRDRSNRLLGNIPPRHLQRTHHALRHCFIARYCAECGVKWRCQARCVREAFLQLGFVCVIRGIVARKSRMGILGHYASVEGRLPLSPNCPLLQRERKCLIVDRSQSENIGITVRPGIKVTGEMVRPTTVVGKTGSGPVEVVPDGVNRFEGQEGCLTMRLSDARLRMRKAKLIYPNHRSPPRLTEDVDPRDRSNRLLCARPALCICGNLFD